MSRAIGDHIAQTVGVICEPEVNVLNINDNDIFIVLCSDGVWEFMSSKEVGD